MRKIAIAELVLDFSIYPRMDVDGQHVHYLCEAYRAGVELPPLVIDKKSKRVIDGFHRVRMYQREEDEAFKAPVVEKTYPSESAILLDAIRYNASHGRTLTQHDRAHCILLAGKLKVPEEDLASALSMTTEKVGKLRIERTGRLRVGTESTPIPLKRTIRHMAGQSLTKRQSEAQDHLSGMDQKFYVNQLILLIDNDLLDRSDERLMERLLALKDRLAKLKWPKQIKATA